MEERFRQIFQQQSDNIQSGDNLTSLFIFFGIIAGVILITVIYNYLHRKYNFVLFKQSPVKKREFNALSRSVGLNYEESKSLYHILDSYHTKNPLTCFTNAKLLDDLLKRGLKDIKKNNVMNDEEKDYESALLLEVKAKIESNSRRNTGIRSTHLMSEEQKLVIFGRNRGYYYAIIKMVSANHMIIELLSKKVSEKVFAKDEYIKLYFWREGDAGYIFHSTILDYGENLRQYKIKHSDRLIRKQKRKYRRIPVNLNGSIYSVGSRYVEERKRYYVIDESKRNCTIIDLSAGGMKVMAEQSDFNEEVIKIVFRINRNEISIVGRIKRMKKNNLMYELTIQNLKIPLKDKNLINEYVYNYTPIYR